MQDYIEVTCADTKRKRLIRIDRIISVSENADGTSFLETFVLPNNKSNILSSHGFECVESCAQIRDLLRVAYNPKAQFNRIKAAVAEIEKNIHGNPEDTWVDLAWIFYIAHEVRDE